MNVQTLAELKASNEAADKAEAAATAEVETVEETEVLEGETEEREEVVADSGEESEGEEVEQEEIEEWAKPAEGSVPVKKHIELRKRLKGQLHEVEDRVAQLEAENAALKAGGVNAPIQQSNAPVMPRMDDPEIGYDDEKFHQAMAEYSDKLIEHKLATFEQKRAQKSQQEQHISQIQAGLDDHYARAEELVLKGVVSEDNYKAADHIVRKAMRESIPNGEQVLDYLITQLGKGSEKVLYHAGIRPDVLSEMTGLLKSDPTGFALAIKLGDLRTKLESSPAIKPKETLRPDRALSGGKVAVSGSKKAYDKAVASDDPVAIMRAKRDAKAKGIDTSKW